MLIKYRHCSLNSQNSQPLNQLPLYNFNIINNIEMA